MLRAADDFETFGPSHQLALLVFVLGLVAVIWVGRAHRGSAAADRFSKGFAVLIPLVTVPLQGLQFLPGDWSLGTSLPFQLCDLAWVAATIALWTHRRRAVGLTYFWGITLTSQGIVTPALAQDFPEPRYLMFWAMHMLVVWSAFYLTFGLGLGPRWQEYRFAVGVTLAWAVAAFGFNLATGTNYGYLNEKPGGASALDLLGPWPVYVAAEVAIVVTGWALMTWPWTRADRRSPQSHAPTP